MINISFDNTDCSGYINTLFFDWQYFMIVYLWTDALGMIMDKISTGHVWLDFHDGLFSYVLQGMYWLMINDFAVKGTNLGQFEVIDPFYF